MNKFMIEKSNGSKISCVERIPDAPKGIVIAVHGFTSSKESPTVQLLLKRLPEAGYGVIGLDLPGHGVSESLKELLRIPGALDSIQAVEEYALNHYPGKQIMYFASSFGAYLIGLYISTREHAGRKAFFRSAAVNMPDLFVKSNPTDEEKKLLEDLERKGYFDTSMDLHSPVRITREMYQDLQKYDLFQIFDPGRYGAHRIAMAHGAADDVIDPKKAESFASRFDVPITLFPGEGHSLSNDPETPDKVVDLALELFGEER